MAVQPYQANHSPQTQRRRPAAKRPTWLLIGGMATFAAALAFTALGILIAVVYWLPGSPSEPRLASGVTVAGLPLGGETVAQASESLAAYDFGAQPVALTDGDRRWSLTLAELGITVDKAATMLAAETAAPGAVVQPVYAANLGQTQDALIALSAQVNIAAVPGQKGRAVDIPAVLNRLNMNLAGELADGVIELTMIETEPPAAEESSQPYTGATTIHVVEQGQELGLIARMYGVDMQDIVTLNDITDPDLLYVGQELTIPAAGLYTPDPAQAPAAPTSAGKSIVVSTDQQRIYAYENGQMVHSYLVSTGLPATPTVKGDYAVYVKHTATDMRGPDYFLPQVPYTMYFYQGYGIHGTYWHNSFGRPMSHGCVNLPVDEAQWFFNWAEVGTPVRVL